MNKNVNHIWTVVCQRGIVDKDSNIVSLLEVLEKINVSTNEDLAKMDQNKPMGVPFPFQVVSYWRKNKNAKSGKGEAQITILSPDNKKLALGQIKFDIPESGNTSRTIVKFDTLPVKTSGEYTVKIQQKHAGKYHTVAEVPFDVTIHSNIK